MANKLLKLKKLQIASDGSSSEEEEPSFILPQLSKAGPKKSTHSLRPEDVPGANTLCYNQPQRRAPARRMRRQRSRSRRNIKKSRSRSKRR